MHVCKLCALQLRVVEEFPRWQALHKDHRKERFMPIEAQIAAVGVTIFYPGHRMGIIM